jgi:hypothetical protein
MDLFASAWWAAERTDDEVRRMVAASDLVVAVTYRPSGRLVGFARVRWGFTDQVGGSRLMRRTADPRLTGSP